MFRRKTAEIRAWFSDPRRAAAFWVAFFSLGMLAVPLGGFAQGSSTSIADIPGKIGAFLILVVAELLYFLVAAVGTILLFVIQILIGVAQYNDFVNSAAVANGWSIVRDVTNMFFILILLLIAFGTMLGIDQYSYKNKTLSRLLIMAVIVNFTRTICGILIDFSQVVMLTFVYGFKDAAGGNFANALRINKLLQNNNPDVSGGNVATFDNAGKGVDFAFGIAMGLFLALLLCGISLIVICYMTVLLVVRIIYLDLLIVISPLAFFLRAVPTGAASKYYGQWWAKFTGQVVFGPLMAFFLWLSLVSVTNDAQMKGFNVSDTKESTSLSSNAVLSAAEIEAFLISICLLVGGTMMAVQMSNETAGGANKLISGGAKAGKAVGGAVGSAKIPFTSSKSRPEGLSLAGLGKGMGQRFRDSNLGQSRLFNKDRRDDVRKQRELAALRATGNTDQAAKMEKDLQKTGADQMTKKYSNDQLKKIMDSDKASQLDRQRAMLAYAQRGGEALKGKGELIGGMVAKVGGGKDFQMSVRQALKSAGDPDAMIMSKDQARREMETSSPKEKARLLQNIDKDVERGADGQPKRQHANDYLMGLDKRSFDAFSDGQQKKVKDALHLAAAQQKEGSKDRLALEAKAVTLTGSFEKELADGLLAKMEGRQFTGRLAAGAAGKETLSPADDVAMKALRKSDRARDYLDQMKNVESAARKPDADPAAIRSQIIELQDGLSQIGKESVKQGASGFMDAAGNAVENDKLIEQSTMAEDLRQAAGSEDLKGAADRLRAASVMLENAVREGELTPEVRVEINDAVSQGKGGLSSANAEFERATSAGSEEDRLKAAKKGASKGIASINILAEKTQDTLSNEVKNELKSLKAELRSVKGAGSMNEGLINRLNDIKRRLSDISEQIG